MTREGTRPVAVIAIAILAAALLAACGGSDSTTTTDTSSESSTTEADSQNGGPTGSTKAKGPKNPGGGQKVKGGSSAQSNGSGAKDYTPKPLQVSGGGSEPFLTKGGDNSIQEYGEEGDESELTEAAEVLHAFLVARADEDWAKTCSYVAKEEVKQLEELGSQSPQLKDKGCPAVVAALAAEPLPPETKRELTEVDAASLRIEDDQAFLIYNGPNNTGYFIRMVDEDGTWKVGGLSPTAFPGG